MKRKIVAIGGGRVISPRGRMPQTLAIDEAIVRLANKRSPRVLFVPTASDDNLEYCEAIERLYVGLLGCKVDRLLLYRARPKSAQIKDKILNADIIYVGGGNTLKMMKLWRRLGVDNYLDKARCNGAVLCGLSAGALCWFRQGNSDSRKFANADNLTLIKVSGLNYVDALVCPHYDVEKHRQPALKTMMRKTPGVAIALDNCAAIEIVDGGYRILTSARRKSVYRVYWQADKYHKEKLVGIDNYMNLKDLITSTKIS